MSGGSDGVVRAGPVSGEEPHLLFGHTGPVTAVVVSRGRQDVQVADGLDDLSDVGLLDAVEIVLEEQVQILRDGPGQAVLHRNHADLRLPAHHGVELGEHGVFQGVPHLFFQQVEQEYPCFKQRHTGIVNGVELFNRNFKPFTVNAVHPVVRKNEK